jgi:hypothetical protein
VIVIVLLFLAYSIGLITVIVQILCYRKKIEYLETIIFSSSFLLLIFALTLNELNLLITNRFNDFVAETVILSMLLLAITTPVNVHSERKISFGLFANRIVYLFGGILFAFIMPT